MEKGGEQTPSKAPLVWGTYTEKTHNIWLWKSLGLNFTSFYNHQSLTPSAFKKWASSGSPEGQ